MKNKDKKIIAIGVVTILCIAVIVVMAVSKSGSNSENQNNDNNQQVNTNITHNTENNEEEQTIFEIPGTKKLGDVEITNIKIEKLDSRKCELTADIRNTSDNYIESQSVRVKTLNDAGEVTETFGGLMTMLAPKEPNTFVTRVLVDITDASDVEFEVIEN